MYLLYVDESGDPGQNGSSHLVLGAAALFEGKWLHLDNDLRTLLARDFPTGGSPTEFHIEPLCNGKGDYRRLSAMIREQLLADFCALVRGMLSTELALFTVIADKRWWFKQNPGKSGDALYAELFEHLSGRFDLFLRRRYAEGSPSKGIIIADEHKASLSRALRSEHRQFQQQGNRWSRLYNLIETVFFLDSAESPGLQLADLCAYAAWRLATANDPRLARSVASCFDREPLNARINPGKWHGVKYLGADPNVLRQINAVWPETT